MAPRRPHIGSLTPIGRGGITKHTGKGSLQQGRGIGGRESMTGGGFGAALNRYPKPSPPPPPSGGVGMASANGGNGDTASLGPPMGGMGSLGGGGGMSAGLSPGTDDDTGLG